MSALNCCGLLETSEKWSNSIQLDNDDGVPSSVVYSCHGKYHMAVATGTILTIAASTSGEKFKNTCDMELDNAVEIMCWGADASCLIVGDICGSLHFITSSGELLFSHRILLKNEESKFVYLGFTGEGKLKSLIAVFANGKIFGMADFCGEVISNLAKNEQALLSSAIRKVKFLKSNVEAHYPISRALVYQLSPAMIDSPEGNNHEDNGSLKDDASLMISLIDCRGDLMVGSIGSVTALQSSKLIKIRQDFTTSSSTQLGQCLDIAMINMSMSAEEESPFAREDLTASAIASTAIALYSDLIALIDLCSNTIFRTFQLDTSSAIRISVVSPIQTHLSDKDDSSISLPRSESVWGAVLIGLQVNSHTDTETHVLAVLNNRSSRNEIFAVQLGSCAALSGGIDCPSTGDFVFSTSVDAAGTGSISTGHTISESVRTCVSTIIKGLDADESPRECDSEEECSLALNMLIGRILRLSGTNYSGTGTGDSAPSKVEVNPFGVEELIDQALDMMTSLHSCGQIASVLNALIVCVSDPPDGFLDRTVGAAEAAMADVIADHIGSNSCKESYLISLDDLKRCVESAKQIKFNFTAGNDPSNKAHGCSSGLTEGVSEEENIRCRTVLLTAHCPCGASVCTDSPLTRQQQILRVTHSHLWIQCVEAGELADASLIMSRHLSDVLSISDTHTYDHQRSSAKTALSGDVVWAAFKAVPNSVPPSDIVAWLKADILPRLHRWTLDPSFQTPGSPSLAPMLVSELCRRASLYAELQDHPFDALAAAELAAALASSFSSPHDQGRAGNIPEKACANMSRKLLTNLQIQAAMWRTWGERNRPTLMDVEDLGLCGLVRERLWTLRDSESEISEDVNLIIEPVLSKFGYDLDDVLQCWARDTVTQRVVLLNEKKNDDCADLGSKIPTSQEEDEEESTCTLSRLVSVVSQIRNPHTRVRSLLLLFQVPAVDFNEEHSAEPSFHHTEESQPTSSSSSSSAPDANTHNPEAGVETVARLCALASSASCAVGPAASEALTEAIRLHRIKTLAASYGVISFDPRDRHQIRAVANVIALKAGRTHAVRDAMEFASSWGTDSADLSGLLTRAVVHRATSTYSVPTGDEALDEATLRDQAIRNVLVQVPSHRFLAVVEDSCTFLIESLEDICDAPHTSDMRIGQLPQQEDEEQASLILRSLLCIISAYLDAVLDGEEVPKGLRKGGDRGSEYPSRAFVSSSWINGEFLVTAKRLRMLQLEERIFLSLSMLGNNEMRNAIATQIAEDQADKMITSAAVTANKGPKSTTTTSNAMSKEGERECQGQDLDGGVSVLTPEIRRLCALLCVSPFVFAHTVLKKMIAKGAAALAMDVARSLGAENSTSTSTSSANQGPGSVLEGNAGAVDGQRKGDDLSVLLDAAVTLCSLAAKQLQGGRTGSKASLPSLEAITRPFAVSRDLLRGVASTCPAEQLALSLDILNGSELVLAVYQRVEGAMEEGGHSVLGPGSSSNAGFKVNESVFLRDGILMTPGLVLGHVLRYSAAEVRRRISISSRVKAEEPVAVDLEELVCALQKSENHMLAVRVLLSSWHLSDAKAQLLRSSLLSLSRKVLSYREIDTSLAVACLVMLPYDAMVRELKAAVPSIQSDFSRLCTVASVGEELARLWDQEGLLAVFQGLQTNAKWWHILSLYGVKIDPRAFQSSDPVQRDLCVRAVVPELLDRSNMDLNQTVDYCRQFDVEPEYAILSYLEKIMVQIPKGMFSGNILQCNETVWARQVRKATMSIDDKVLLRTLRILLPKIHPLDYEKIRFLSTWIVTALEEEVEMEQDNTSQRALADEKNTNGKKQRTISYGEKATEEAESCRRYADIVTYLSSVSFPLEATRNIAKAVAESKAAVAALDVNYSIMGSAVQGPGPGIGGVDWEQSYNEVTPQYRARIPFWTLLSDPWLVITPLLIEAPEIAAKLQPVCRALNIDKDDFATRRVMAAYHRLGGHVQSVQPLAQGLSVPSDDAAYVLAVEFLPTVSCVVKKVQLWHWLYAQEREKKKDKSALKFLISGLEEINYYKKLLKLNAVAVSEDSEVASTVDELLTLRGTMTAQLTLLKCENTLRTLDHSTSTLFTSKSDRPFIAPFFALLPHVEEPSLMLRKVLIMAAESAWDAQLWALKALGCEMLCSQEIPHRPLAPAVLAYLRIVGVAILDIAAHTQFVDVIKPVPGSDSTGPSVAGVGGIESLRHGMIGKMLADVDSAAGSGGKDGTSSCSSGVGSNPLGSGLWSQLEESSLRVGAAESRRREDVYLGFCIAALVACCEDQGTAAITAAAAAGISNSKGANSSSSGNGGGGSSTNTPPVPALALAPAPPSKRASYVAQLQAVVLGKGAKSQRRLTIRSRLRAAYALQLILAAASSDTAGTGSGSGTGLAPTGPFKNESNGLTGSKGNTVNSNDFNSLAGQIFPELARLIPFLHCFAELQETRLPCSEEALMEALNSPSAGDKDKHTRTDARVLVRTWLHDEGYHQEVVELGRDLLLSACVLDPTAWEGLLRHMSQRQMTRTFIQTLLLLLRLRPLPLGGVLKGPLREIVLSTVRTFAKELVEKTEQVCELAKSRGDVSGSPATDSAPSSSSADTSPSGTIQMLRNIGMCNALTSVNRSHDAEDTYCSSATASNTNNIFPPPGPCTLDSSPSSSRVVLVERCHSSSAWEEAPEDLALSLSQLCVLWEAISSSCGGHGARDVGVQLVQIVGRSLAASVSGSTAGLGTGRSRGVDRVVRHHAEACAVCLLKIPCHPLGGQIPRSSAGLKEEAEYSSALCLLRAGVQAGAMRTEGVSACRGDAQYFLWRMLSTCCTAFQGPSVRRALSSVCTSSEGFALNADLLSVLLVGAADTWHLDRESRTTTQMLLSWCISVARDEQSAGDSSHVSADTPRDTISSALRSLGPARRKSLGLAVELLSSQLSHPERAVLLRLF